MMMQMTFTKFPKAISAEELLSTPLPPVKWIIPGLLPAGLALFAGPSKVGKSWLTLWLCLQIAQGKFSHDGNDADDANDVEIDITQLCKWDISQTASSASLASQRSRKESKHGRSVATGRHPAEKPTGPAPNPCEAESA